MNKKLLKNSRLLKHPGEIKSKTVFWIIADLDRSYHFYIGDMKAPKHELFIEYDELLGANPAFENELPLSMLQVLDRLDKEYPGTSGIQTLDGAIVILKKDISTPGILLTINDRVKDFFSNQALSTINFLDFYTEIKEDSIIDERPSLQPTHHEERDEEKGITLHS